MAITLAFECEAFTTAEESKTRRAHERNRSQIMKHKAYLKSLETRPVRSVAQRSARPHGAGRVATRARLVARVVESASDMPSLTGGRRASKSAFGCQQKLRVSPMLMLAVEADFQKIRQAEKDNSLHALVNQNIGTKKQGEDSCETASSADEGDHSPKSSSSGRSRAFSLSSQEEDKAGAEFEEKAELLTKREVAKKDLFEKKFIHLMPEQLFALMEEFGASREDLLQYFDQVCGDTPVHFIPGMRYRNMGAFRFAFANKKQLGGATTKMMTPAASAEGKRSLYVDDQASGLLACPTFDKGVAWFPAGDLKIDNPAYTKPRYFNRMQEDKRHMYESLGVAASAAKQDQLAASKARVNLAYVRLFHYLLFDNNGDQPNNLNPSSAVVPGTMPESKDWLLDVIPMKNNQRGGMNDVHAQPSPEGAHQDGAVFTLITLLRRTNLTENSSESRIWSLAQPAGYYEEKDFHLHEKNCVFRRILREMGETIILLDREVKHEGRNFFQQDATKDASREILSMNVRQPYVGGLDHFAVKKKETGEIQQLAFTDVQENGILDRAYQQESGMLEV